MWEKYFQIHKFVKQKQAHDKKNKNVPKYLKRYSYDQSKKQNANIKYYFVMETVQDHCVSLEYIAIVQA